MCLAGGIPPSLLIGGGPDEVTVAVRAILTEMMDCAGFIFSLPFNALGPAKPENVIAMTEAVWKYGDY